MESTAVPPVRIIDEVWLEGAEAVARQLAAEGEVDVIITGGANAAVFRRALSVPVVEFRVSALDLLTAIASAADRPGPVGVVTYEQKLAELESVSHLLRVDVRTISYRSVSELDELLQECVRSGFSSVVGSSRVCERAALAGLHPILIYSRGAILEAVETALEMARATRLELERAERLKTIIDFAYSGIIATDERNRITVFNPTAERILGRSAREVIGKIADEALGEEFRLLDVVPGGRLELDRVQRVGETEVMTNRVPIAVGGKVRGVVTTFQDADTLQRQERKLRRILADRGLSATYTFHSVLGSSPALQRTMEMASQYAGVDSTVLILGETGTGKEVFAQSIHNAGRRRHRPFVAVNCAALPEQLLESELFGYEEGAFTGARKGGKQGLFELAHGGTIFLDEIGEMPLSLQARLLRVLQERQIMRVGSDRMIPVDIRVIAATNRNLGRVVKAGSFRADLYYRLDVLRLELPALRERSEDIPGLSARIMNRLDPMLAGRLSPLLPRLLTLYQQHSWPGNVRELENLIERFVVRVQGRQLRPEEALALLRETLEQQLRESQQQETGSALPVAAPPERVITVDDVRTALAAARGNRAKAARSLGISRTTLYRKLHEV